MTGLIKRFPKNTSGRDFIIGDVHGAFNTVWKAIKAVGFDLDRDRLFCTGDLIDRGPKSVRVTEFLKQPYVHSIRGNHEDMLLALHEGLLPDQFPQFGEDHFMVVRNGMGWWRDVSVEKKIEILEAIKKLPIAIEVETHRGLVGIVHAEVPKGWSWQEMINHIETAREIKESIMWGRDRIMGNDKTGVPGIDRVFVGHTIRKDGAQRYGNVFAIDTGAIFAEVDHDPHNALTMMNLTHRSEALVGKEFPALNILNEPNDAPFGNYTMR